VLGWRIMALLRDVEESPRFAPVRAYLARPRDDFRRYELACRIADCFDQYLVYRPDWIGQWEAGGEDHWQAELWRRLAQSGDEAHRVRVQEQFRATWPVVNLTSAVCRNGVAIIGVAALPPLMLDVLAGWLAMSMCIYFVLNPCQEYWGDIQAERDLASAGRRDEPG
jgi:exodeoxyribonuclease V gamma subunit